MSTIRLPALSLVVVLVQQYAAAQVILNHAPYPSAAQGPTADTLFPDPFGSPTWQLLADDFVLDSAVGVRSVGWWGFYGGTFGEASPNPPSGEEIMRVRFYGSRPGDGLPNTAEVLYEESIVNPLRVWTGRINGNQREYFFESDLASTVQLSANTTYWFEVVQVGDVQSLFRWQYSLSELTGIAFLNANVPDWTHALTVDLAFQLTAIPEPSGLALTALTALYLCRRRSYGRRYF